MKLRKWQKECSKKAIEHFTSGSKHFFCLATPGAGKSVMAADVAKSLLSLNLIDLILCFSPSTNISVGLKDTLSNYLSASFNGYIGDLGASYTYQSLPFFNKDFWSVLSTKRVLVIFDEIHHCAGQNESKSNVWGEEIITHIQDTAAYTLALSGTPWRSDNLPITLAPYNTDQNTVSCNYIYGMSQAIRDDVCRVPNIILVDNENIQIQSNSQVIEAYSSLIPFVKDKGYSYRDILHNKEAISYILNRGCQILNTIRKENPNAAGLVVASSINHAVIIKQLLIDKFHQSVVFVSHKDRDAQHIINSFKHGSQKWIVSIGMISEGTDIPRLQVCCHLSNIKTELYFRQVLGRVLRVNNSANKDAWLLTFNEESLQKFANRISQELPEHAPICFFEKMPLISSKDKKSQILASEQPNFSQEKEIRILFEEGTYSDFQKVDANFSILFLGKFSEQILDLY
ncbi:MAG: DEAD/DEAH box helicase family protein [Gammaproteobacteria bacterium]|nr:DEAD/DEAH box helicase family protein [Gammaproteobacteria bacterium]